MLYVLGGSPCCGKSTAAQAIARERGFVYYDLDHRLYDLEGGDCLFSRAVRDGKPHCAYFQTLSQDEIWLRSPRIQCDEEFRMYEELFPYVREELLTLSEEKTVITEGAGYLPWLMPKLRLSSKNYICLVPTKEFQVQHYAAREWVKPFLSGCSSPETAFDNWMERDHLFAQETALQAYELGYQVYAVDGSQDEEETLRVVKETFQL